MPAVCVWLVPNLRLTAFIPLPMVTETLSVLWIVALINAFNMLDNMDGLSAGVAAIAAGFLAAVMLLAPEPEIGRSAVICRGVVAGLVGSLARLFVAQPAAGREFSWATAAPTS